MSNITAVLAAQDYQVRATRAYQFRTSLDAAQNAGPIEALFAEELKRQTHTEVMSYLTNKIDDSKRLQLDGRGMNMQERGLLIKLYGAMLKGDLEGLCTIAKEMLTDESLASRVVRETATDFAHAPFLLEHNLNGTLSMSLQSVDGTLVFLKDGTCEVQIDMFASLQKPQELIEQIAQDEMKFQAFMLKQLRKYPF